LPCEEVCALRKRKEKKEKLNGSARVFGPLAAAASAATREELMQGRRRSHGGGSSNSSQVTEHSCRLASHRH